MFKIDNTYDLQLTSLSRRCFEYKIFQCDLKILAIKSIVEQFRKLVTVHDSYSAEKEKPDKLLIDVAYLMNIKLSS
jgi:hypothetical protein